MAEEQTGEKNVSLHIEKKVQMQEKRELCGNGSGIEY